MSDTDKVLEVAVYAARTAGSLLVSYLGGGRPRGIAQKDLLDYVTDADRESEKTIRKVIGSRFPDHSILAEEGGLTEKDKQNLWVVDPLDGTINYISSFPFFCVSVGFVREGSVEVGVVYDPIKDELFHAARGKGAYLNGSPIRVNAVSDLSTSIVFTGFPHRIKECFEPHLASFRAIFEISAGIRQLGSAALHLCYTAMGRADGFWEPRLSPWDIAAGSLIVTEAGGIVTDFTGALDYLSSGDVVCGSPKSHEILLNIIGHAFADSGGA